MGVEPVIPGIGPTPGMMGSTGTVVVVADVELEGATVVVVEGVAIPRIFKVCLRSPVWVNAFCAGVRI